MKTTKQYDVFTIIETNKEEDKNYWCKIGTGFLNRDQSINLIFNALPVNGRVQIRERKDEDSEKSE